MSHFDRHHSLPPDRRLRFNEIHFFSEYPLITREQLADLYGFSLSTLKRRLKELHIELPNRPFDPHVVKIIFDHLGYPPRCDKYYE